MILEELPVKFICILYNFDISLIQILEVVSESAEPDRSQEGTTVDAVSEG